MRFQGEDVGLVTPHRWVDDVMLVARKRVLLPTFMLLVGAVFLALIPTTWATPSAISCDPGTIPLTAVTITGPTKGAVNVSYGFTAIFTPANATQPIVYTWQPAPALGQGTAIARYVWTTAGNKTITVTAHNPGQYVCGDATDEHVISIVHLVNLPVIAKQAARSLP